MKNRSFNLKIVFVMALQITAALGTAYLGLSSLNKVEGLVDKIVKDSHQKIIHSSTMREHQTRLLQKYTELLLDKESSREQVVLSLQKEALSIQNEMQAWRIIASQDRKKKLLIYESHLKDLMTLIQKQIEGLKSHQSGTSSEEIQKQIDQNFEAMDQLMEEAILHNTNTMNNTYKDSKAQHNSTFQMMWILSVVSIGIAILLAYFILKSLSRSINTVTTGLDENSIVLSSAAEQIAAASNQLAEAAAEEASILTKTSAAVEQMDSMLQKNLENAKNSLSVSLQSQESATKGQHDMEGLVQAIHEIKNSTDLMQTQINSGSKQLEEIIEMMKEISEKAQIINEIVFQTKLLSFNASIEAARAGEHGKGFSVVAAEVGKLAKMSGEAADEITKMLQTSTIKVEGIIKSTTDSIDSLAQANKNKVTEGISIAKTCAETLKKMADDITSVASMSQDISKACQEQSIGIQEINKAMMQMDQTTTENAAATEQVASAAKTLSSQALTLRNLVDLLVVTIKGSQKPQQQMRPNLKIVPHQTLGKLQSLESFEASMQIRA